MIDDHPASVFLRNQCIHELFEASVKQAPDAAAVIFEDEQLTYQELNRRANQLAYYLRSLGVGPEICVGICAERSVEMVVGLLGILKSGGAYVPLDPSYPKERLRFMMNDASISVVLLQERLIEVLPTHNIEVISLDTGWKDISRESWENLTSAAVGSNLVYVIYTSGSTGQPKGVMNTHQGLWNRLMWMQDVYQLREDDRVLQKTPYSFDVSVWEFFWPLLVGAQLLLARPGGQRDNTYLVDLIAQRQITTLHFVPSMLSTFLQERDLEGCKCLRRVFCSGETLPFEVQERFFARLEAELHNLYGPTESSIDVTFWECQRESQRRVVPIGFPIANTQIHLLDTQLQPVHSGEIGELYIESVGLARGYLQRPDLTAERFIPNPQSITPGARLYQTGDLARYLADGAIEFLGRLDDQVKMRGLRIELGEIEAVLREHPAVQDAVVMVREDVAADKRLVAYLVPDQQYAFPVRQLLPLEKAGVLPPGNQYELPNGMTIAHLNKNETNFVYNEIFVEQAYLSQGITLNEGDCIFDVGANIGLFTLFVGQRCKNATIYAFEPIPTVFDVLRLNTHLYGPDVKLFACGLSHKSGYETFTYYPYVSIMSGRLADATEEKEVIKSFLQNEQLNSLDGMVLRDEVLDELLAERLVSKQMICQVKTLSEIIRENDVQRIDLLKIDVEKSELDVLMGLAEEDWHKIKQIIVEVYDINARSEQITALLKSHGYSVTVQQETLLKDTAISIIFALRPSPSINQHVTGSTSPSVSPAEPIWNSKQTLLRDVGKSLKERLPDYMIPSSFVLLEAIPLTANGKIDRHALPEPALDNFRLDENFLAPRTPIEELLASIWAEVLRRERVGIHDSFFEYGGHSLLVTQVISRLRDALQVELPLHTFFAAPTIANLAEIVEEKRHSGVPQQIASIKPVPRNGNLPLSFAQERTWFILQLNPNNRAYHFQAMLRFEGPLDPGVLERSLTEIVRRHEIFRTTFPNVAGYPVQCIHQAYTVKLPLINLQVLPEHERESASQRLIQQELQKPFDLEQLPLVRWVLLQVHPQEHILLHIEHHIVHDGWSFNLFLSELRELYAAFIAGKPSPLPELPIQFIDFASWQRQWIQGEPAEMQLAYWKKKLAHSPPLLALPTDRPRPAVQSFQGRSHRIELPVELCEALRALCHREGVTLFMTMLAAFALLLSRYSGQDDVCIGSGIANRRWRETEKLIGMIINTVVLRIDLSNQPTFRELLQRVREVTLEAYIHQDLPFDKVVEALQPRRHLSFNPLFQVMFAFHDSPLSDIAFPDLTTKLVEGLSNGSAKFDLNITVIPRSEQQVGQTLHKGSRGITMIWEYSTDLFDAITIQRMLMHYKMLLEGIVANAEQYLTAFPMVSEEERHQLLVEWQSQEVEYPQDKCLHELFEDQVERTPDAVAVILEDEHLTYRELNLRANQVAAFLQKLHVRSETLVGICVERSIEMLIGILGILKAGGGYVPLDPATPKERLAFILQDAQVSVLLTHTKVQAALPEHKARVIYLDADWQTIVQEHATTTLPIVRPDNLAYVIYTSGSSGTPKGVLVNHRQITRLFAATQDWFHFNERDVWTFFHSYAFDFSVWEIWGALLYGGRLVLVPYWISRTPEAFYALLSRAGVTVLNQTPSAFRQLIQVEETSTVTQELALRLIIFGGEALELQSLKCWFERHEEQLPQLVNMYGITETTVHVTYRPLTVGDLDSPSSSLIGRAIPDLQVYILDSQLQPVPIGIPGELYIGGAGVTRGYLNRPELTSERFLPDPFSSKPGARLYRTGDVARYLATGDIEYIGRNDQQVKLRGFRIELGEIEAVLAKHPAVRECVVLLREDEASEKSLVAYIVPDSTQSPTVNDIRHFLKEQLPEHLIPSAFVPLDALPLTPNGKLDRHALPVPSYQPQLEAGFVAPRTRVEEVLAGVWSQVLGVEPIGIHNNYFALGGDSIRSVRLIALAEERGLHLTPLELFQHQTIYELAEALQAAKAGSQVLPQCRPFSLISKEDYAKLPEQLEDAYPLTMLQAGMLFHSEYHPDTAIYHNITSIHLHTHYDLERLESTIQQLLASHPILRTSFDLTTFSKPLQLVHQQIQLPLQVADLRHVSFSEQEKVITEWIEAEKQRKFDWTLAPLLRFQVHRRSEETFQFTLTEHHAILDGWSVASLLTELFQIYLTSTEFNDTTTLPAPSAQFRDFVVLEQEILRSEEAQRFWDQKLSESSIITLPRWHETERTSEAPTLSALNVPISREISDDLKHIAQEAAVPLKSVLLAAHLKVMSLLSGQTDILTGLVANGRPETADGDRVLGLFLNTVPYRQRLTGGSWIELVRETFETEREALLFRRYPLSQIQKDQGGQPLFETAFNFVHFHVYERMQALSNLHILSEQSFAQTNFTLVANFSLNVSSSQIELKLSCNGSELCDEQIQAIGNYYLEALTALSRNPTSHYERVSLFSYEEQYKRLEWNNSQAEYPQNMSIHELFEAQVERSPDAVAVVYEDKTETYHELNLRANQVAQHLRTLCRGPEIRVGVCMERSPEMITGILGILKAGGAYVPLDPTYPTEQLIYMLERAQITVLLTQERLQLDLFTHGVHVVYLDTNWEDIATASTANPGSRMTANNLAYIIYTSGSTGRPKGAGVYHQGFVNLLNWFTRTFAITARDRVLLMTSLSFDLTQKNIFAPLILGGTLFLHSSDYYDSEVIVQSIFDKEITLLNCTPSAFYPLVDHADELKLSKLQSLRYLFLGGEPISMQRLEQWRMSPGNSAEIVNTYGPTECTDIVAFHCLERLHQYTAASVPIGKPIFNVKLLVLDENLCPLPVGVAGELYVAGDSVGMGYINDTALSAAKFIPNPFTEIPGTRLYKTGDQVRYLPDGRLEFLGRIDHQVKLRGFRIELGEIETTLNQHPTLQEAVALVREDVPGDKRLVAYIVPAPQQAPTISDLRNYLKANLPGYMVPSSFVIMDALPLTPNGKVNRRALPIPDGTRPEMDVPYVMPRNPIEELLTGIWTQILGSNRIGIYDNFFELGGDSLLATQFTARVRSTFQIEMPLQILFEKPAIADLAVVIAQLQDSQGNGRISRVNRVKRANKAKAEHLLTHMQQLTDKDVDTLLTNLLSESKEKE